MIKDCIKEKIILTARKEFSFLGFKETTMRTIAEKSGIGVGNLYNYFKSKTELWLSVTSNATQILNTLQNCKDPQMFWDIVYENRVLLRIFLFKGENFNLNYQRNEKEVAKSLEEFISKVWFYHLMEELLLHKPKKDIILSLIIRYLSFNNFLLNNNINN